MVQIENESALLEAVKDVRNDGSETNWCLAVHVENNPELLRFAGSGSGGYDEMASCLDDSAVMYGILRITQKIDLSVTVKFVYIYFIGEQVPALQRGKIGTVHGEVVKIFSPYHINFEITNASDLSGEMIEKKMAETAGKMDNVRELSYDEKLHERGFTATTTKNSGAKKSAFGFQGQASEAAAGNTLPSDPSVPSSISEVRSDKSGVNWALASYQNNDVKSPVTLVASGNGGADEMASHFQNDMIAYGLIRVIDIIEGIKTIKFCFVTYIGPDVSIMKKAKVATHKGGVNSLFGPFHVSLEISSSHEISDEILLSLVQDASGSKSKVKG